MCEPSLDRMLPTVRNLASRKASAFVRRYGFAIDESEDIASHLVVAFLARWPKFDGHKASLQTFASRLMDKELMSVLRYRLARGRQVRELPKTDAGPSAESIHEFRVDLERAMACLPEVVRETAVALSTFSAIEAAEAVGCSRQMISRRKHQIRQALLAAGITSSYFVSIGTRP